MPSKNIDLIDFDLDQILPSSVSTEKENGTTNSNDSAKQYNQKMDTILDLLNHPLSQYDTLTINTSDGTPYIQLVKKEGAISFEILNPDLMNQQCEKNVPVKECVRVLHDRFSPLYKTKSSKAPEHRLRKPLVEKNADFSYESPHVKISTTQLKKMKELGVTQEQVIAKCHQDFAKAQLALDRAIGEVLKNDPLITGKLKEFSERFIQLIDGETQTKRADFEKRQERLKALRHPDPHASKLNKKMQELQKAVQFELTQNAALSKLIAQAIPEPGKPEASIDFGNIQFQGFTGMNPLSTRNVVKTGNLRELIFLLFGGRRYIPNLLKNEEHVKQLNALLFKNNGWMFNMEQIKELLAIKETSPYHEKGTDRVERTPIEIKEYLQSHPPRKVKEESIPFSQRETMALSGEHRVPLNPERELEFETGARYKTGTDPNNPYTQASKATFQPAMAGISATSARLIKQALLLGFNTPEDLETLKLACLAFFTLSQNHTAHEVLMGLKGFGLPYTPGPQGYKDIYPKEGRKEFIAQLSQQMKSQGFNLPDYYLSSMHVESIIHSLSTKHKMIKPTTS